jgi:predicted nucleic acid-binding protein
VIIVDTSVWIDHLRKSDLVLADLLENGRVLTHPFVTGEIALGSLSRRSAVLDALRGLPQAIVARDDEVMVLIERDRLFSAGIGYIDAHLLAAAKLTPGASIWTRDRRLREVSVRLGLSAGLD